MSMRKRAATKLTQTEKAYNAIKEAILQGDIEEGVFLSETDTIARYGIGRTPYREACNRLHHEGLLQVVPRRGYYIPEISFHAVCDLFEIRIILEDAIAQLAAVRATDEEIDELQRLASRPLPSGRTQNEFRHFVQTNTEFHLGLARTTRNRQMVELLTRNLESTERLMYVELRSRRFRENDFRMLHQRIVDALRGRDPLRVREAVWEDINEAQGSTLAFSNAMPREEPLVGRTPTPVPTGAPSETDAGSRLQAAGKHPATAT
jgi:DNA-binding GntR family transcriptional regulator